MFNSLPPILLHNHPLTQHRRSLSLLRSAHLSGSVPEHLLELHVRNGSERDVITDLVHNAVEHLGMHA
jgi:hypothetical protein